MVEAYTHNHNAPGPIPVILPPHISCLILHCKLSNKGTEWQKLYEVVTKCPYLLIEG